ncbi:acetate--CoA ligase family protein [Falsiroseomonas selenitidurans]|uniref:acetate--CoA ligase family protein n=1 Tax=Falsiroseomonas selenitidurans TaxID=2716335 RepID=UPI002E2AA04A|nr:acetate--CoA ligase family protein [Falsiroseomonas selenitidurans]
MNPLEALLRPRSVAVVGASADPTKTGGRPVGYLLRHGFAGDVWPVNPRATEIAGLPCYRDVASLPGAPDVGIVLVGPERAEAAVRDLAARGCQAAIVLAGGYGETGEAGAEKQSALKRAAGPMRLLGPNTIGVVNLTDRIVLSATGALEFPALPPGGLSVVSQSGGILGALLSRGAAAGIGFAKLVATGNEGDLEVAEVLDALVDDPATTAIALYLEGLRNPGRFRAAARRAAAAGKPVVAFKVGRSEAGALAAISHTGAMAGADRMYDAFFAGLGVIRAERFAELLEVPAALALGRRAAGFRVAVLTSTGGAGALVADAVGLAGGTLPAPDAAVREKLAALLGEAPVGNPVDVTLAGLQPDLFRGAIRTLLDSDGYDQLVVVVGSSALAQPDLVADAMLEARGHSVKPVIAYVSPHAPHIAAGLNARGVPASTTPEGIAAILAALARPVPALPESQPVPALPSLPSGRLNEAESKALFAHFGIQGAREVAATTPEAAQAAAAGLGDRLVVKLLARDLAHKSDIGGVVLGVTPDRVAAVGATLLARLPGAEGLLVQEQVSGGIEMILGIVRDPHLGSAVLLGAGGTAAEVFGDTQLRMLPLTRADAEAMVRGLKVARVLAGFRGAPPADVPALVDAVLAFSRMGEALGDRLLEAEINPLFVLPAGQGVRAADGLAVLA